MRNIITYIKTKTCRNKLSIIRYPLSVVLSVVVIACGNPQDDDVILNIQLGGGSSNYSASALTNWPPADGTELASLKYEVTLIGPAGQKVERKDIPGDSSKISFGKLSTGYWTVTVKAFSDSELYAYSFAACTLKRGNNEVFMMMQRAGEYEIKIIIA